MLFVSRVRVRFSVWLVSGYAHVFVLLSVVIVTLLFCDQKSLVMCYSIFVVCVILCKLWIVC